ncbi:hypothetical protein [Alcanivorax sp.]|uniref:hypothetical protein n=1 Tax=Alcanivorax sp. TaxID=1872427 RepID=UPI003A8F23CE
MSNVDMQINETGRGAGRQSRKGVVCWLGRVALLLSLVAAARADDFNYSAEQFALIAGYESCVRQLAANLGSDQRDALTDKLLRSKGISYQPRRVENDRRLWAYPEYATQRRTQSYMIQAFKQDCLEQNAGRY